MEEIEFSTNWNNKLDCKAFTTLRLHNERKYKIGCEYAIRFKGTIIKTAIIEEIKHVTLNSLNPFICFLDTGYSVSEVKEILQKMYPILKTNPNQIFDFILLITVKIPKEAI